MRSPWTSDEDQRGPVRPICPDDPRITRSGPLPQAKRASTSFRKLVNVLRGEMSLVGPRADIVEQVANYPDRTARLASSGQHGAGRRSTGATRSPGRSGFELGPVVHRHWSLALDAKIVVRTSSTCSASGRSDRGRDEHRAREGPARRTRVTQRPAVVFGLLWAGLALARSLGRSGVPVTGLAYEPTDFGISRGTSHANRQLARPRRAAARDVARGRGRRTRGPFSFRSATRASASSCATGTRYARLADLPLPDDAEIVHRLRRKDLLRAEAEKAGVSMPATVTPTDEASIRSRLCGRRI
jgi:hypothetical protein